MFHNTDKTMKCKWCTINKVGSCSCYPRCNCDGWYE